MIQFLSLLRVLWKISHLMPNKKTGPVEDAPAMSLELNDLQSSFHSKLLLDSKVLW